MAHSDPKGWVDTLVTSPMTAETIHDLSLAFKKVLMERTLGAEFSHHLGYAPGESKPEGIANHRSGIPGKTVLTEEGQLHIEVPRDREGWFEPLGFPCLRGGSLASVTRSSLSTRGV